MNKKKCKHVWLLANIEINDTDPRYEDRYWECYKCEAIKYTTVMGVAFAAKFNHFFGE